MQGTGEFKQFPESKVLLNVWYVYRIKNETKTKNETPGKS